MRVDNAIFFAAVEEQLREGQRVRLNLSGTSMEPSIHDGEPIVIAPSDGSEQVGDVVLFRYGGGHRLHRIVAATGDNLTLQGDNCYGNEQCHRSDVVAKLVEVPRLGAADGEAWQRTSRRALRRKHWRNLAVRWLGRQGRRQLRPWYFLLLAVLMWAPLNGLGLPLDNYILGLRADHLLHASVYLPCALFLIDIVGPMWLVWLASAGIGMLTEGVQWLLPYRGFDINDLVANFLGVTLGWLVILTIKRKGSR